MNILMMTNTYTPVVGGLERSVRDFTLAYRRRGHRAVVVAPVYAGMPKREEDVIRIPSIQRFTRLDFSVKLPLPPKIANALLKIRPDVIHAHHPFLIGNTALRLASRCRVPLVFTHHTLFEQYTHYLPVDTAATERFVMELSTGYANMCDVVFAPSQSVAMLLRQRGVTTPVAVVPTGIDCARYAHGATHDLRKELGIPPQAFVVGFVGRLAQEKNLGFWTDAVTAFLYRNLQAHVVVVGSGPLWGELEARFLQADLGRRVHFLGLAKGQRLLDAYGAMDVFAFTSKSETQGLVVIEAMAAGLPVIALDAPGVRDVVRDRKNGRLLPMDNAQAFAMALEWLARLPATQRRALGQSARQTAREFSMDRCAARALSCYASAVAKGVVSRAREGSRWTIALRQIQAEWKMLKTVTKAAQAAMRH